MILYISKRFETNIAAKVHRAFLVEKYGEENIFTVDMRPEGYAYKENYIRFDKYRTRIHRIGRWLKGYTMYMNTNIVCEICRIISSNGINIVFIEDSIFGSIVKAIKDKYPDVKVVVFFHDIAAELYVEWAKKNRIIGKIENRIAIKQEHISQRYSDVDMVFNKRDAELYKKYYGKEPNYIVPIAMPSPAGITNETIEYSEKEKKILFVGSKYYPNIIGIRWFYNEVLPNLSYNMKLKIIGRGTEFLSEEFTDSRVLVVGTVDSVEPYYKEADIVIAPLFNGGGMKCKTVEAIGYGKYLLGTNEGLQGFWETLSDNLKRTKIFCTDKKEEWISILNNLLEMEQIPKFNQDVYKFFNDNFSYEATRQSFLAAI